MSEKQTDLAGNSLPQPTVMRRSKNKDMKTEQEKLEEAVDSFAFEMKERLIEKMKQGYTGWDKTNVHPSDEYLADSIVEDANYLRRQIQEGLTPSTFNMADIANRLMMVFYRHNAGGEGREV